MPTDAQFPRIAAFSGGGYDDSESHSASGSSKNDDKKGSSDKERKGVINRVNRACNNCRRMKMRCVGAEDPPCKRCRNGGLECVMEKPGRTANDHVGEDRIRSLENQVTSIQDTLTELVQTLRAGPSSASAASNGSGQTPINITTTPDFPRFGSNTTASPSHQGTPSSFSTHARPGHNSGGSLQGLLPRTSADTINPYATVMPNTAASSTSPSSFRRPALPLISRQSWQPFPIPETNTATSGMDMSLPPSRAGSEGADEFGNEDITNPLGVMSNMAGLVEAAVERAREEKELSDPAKRSPFDNDGPPAKRARWSFTSAGSGPAVVEAQPLPQSLGPTKSKARKRTHVHAYPDVVDNGVLSEAEGRELMETYYSGSSNFIPCYDPTFDTWESLKIRSPFSITTILMVGAKVRDGGGPESEIQQKCREHAQLVAKNTMFNQVMRIEAVQAVLTLAAFSDGGWLPGGHAVRMAIDMGVNKSFINLLRGGMGKGKTPEQLEEERPLVVHSRLYLMEHQMAYGMGRPAILREDETIHQCRRLLEHPLSIPSDARLISSVELIALRSPLHVELTASPDLPVDQHTLQRLKLANTEFDAWERYWDRVLTDRYHMAKDDFFRESLVIQRQYAELFVNSQLLRGIREPSDVVSMPEEKRALAIRAMRNAQHCLDICLRSDNYRSALRYAVHYTHVCAAFAASFLVRIARLFPQELNLKKTAKDVEELAKVLAEVPAGRYARSLRLILRRARRARVIPAPSTRASPTRDTPASGHAPAVEVSTTDVQPFLAATTSPSNLLLNATQQIFEDSPSSANEISEFDFLFAQENLERSGLTINEGDPLPLFLDGHSLGGSQAPTDMTAFVGLEHFFIPASVDNRLNPSAGPDDHGLGDLWW